MNGMTISKAASLASTKLDRVMNDGTLNEDSMIDFINYGVIMLLITRGVWMNPMDETEEERHPWTVAANKLFEKKSKENIGVLSLLSKIVKKGWIGILQPKKKGDVGYDIVVSEKTIIPAHAIGFNVPSDAAVKVPDGYFMMIINRSSAIKRNLIVVPGIIDNGYTGPIYSIVNNQTDSPVVLEIGDRVAQGILLPAFTPPVVEVEELPETERGDSGFGSTGL